MNLFFTNDGTENHCGGVDGGMNIPGGFFDDGFVSITSAN